MTLPAVKQVPSGLSRSAALMRALGPQASAIWNALSPEEAARLRAQMQVTDAASPGDDVTASFFQEMSQPQIQDQSCSGAHSGLANLRPDQISDLIGFIAHESPQITALVLSITPEETAAATVQVLPKDEAIQALHRLLKLGDVHPAAITAVETAFAARVKLAAATNSSGPDRLAGIMNLMDSELAPTLMAGLEELQPGSAARIRSLMFTFDDLAALDPASLQTLLANTDRALLILALQDARPATADAFFSNMTQRAGEVLRSEIETAGPYRRAEIEEARREIATLARKLARRGELMSAKGPDKDLIE